VLEQPTALSSLSTAFIADHQSAITAAAAADTSRRSERQEQAFGPQHLGKAAETAAAKAEEEGACSVEEEEEGRCSVRTPAGEQVGVYAAGRGQCVSAGVKVGDSVEAGSPMLALSVMKMEEVVVAPVCGRVVWVLMPGERASASGLVAVLSPLEPQDTGSNALPAPAVGDAGTQFTCFIGTKVQILTRRRMMRLAKRLDMPAATREWDGCGR
jgi:biotin carboxyl carrier protein